ncbi:Helicase [Dactylella cylindrospora]|nr:Helicase [Dactylella cylindrospora]
MTGNPIRLWSLQVPPTGEIIALEELGIPINVAITMAAIDPTEEVKGDGPKLSTLRIVHQNIAEPEIDDFDDDESIDSDLASGDDSEEGDSEEEEDSEDEKTDKKGKAAKPKAKGEKKVLAGKDDEDDDEDDEDDEDYDSLLAGLDSDDEDDYQEVVVCTLDPTKAYQQPLQLTIGDSEPVFFKASGAYTIYLTGNYVTEPRQLPPTYDSDEEDDLYSEEDEDESMDEDDEYQEILARIKSGDFDEDSDEESDELDDIDNPRITELEDDEDEAPALVSSKKPEETLTKKEKAAAAKAAQLKAKAAETAAKSISAKENKKRSADEMDIDATATTETLANGATITTATATATAIDTPPSSLSKKQQKKLKANSGEAVAVSTPTEKKKVQFATQLEQGPTPNGNKSPATPVEKPKAAEKDEKPTAASSKSRTVDGVKIEDHKLGSGPEAKRGQKVSMRYIGKLTDGKVFDSNKKGKPFTFQLGKGDVIKGWDIGVAGMKVGGERKLVIPPNLAYGNKSLPGIPKNSTLVFEVKLLEVK